MDSDMDKTLHLTSGDVAGDLLKKSGVPGEVFVWHDILYEGLRRPGWPDVAALEVRADFLEAETGGGLDRETILRALKSQYEKLSGASQYDRVVMWFDACLFDQSMMVHVLACLRHAGYTTAELLCLNAFPGIVPFHGLGQMNSVQLASVYGQRRAVTSVQFDFAVQADKAFADRDVDALRRISKQHNAPLPWIPHAAARWLQEQPNPQTGLGRLESLVLEAVEHGCDKPLAIYQYASTHDTPPQFWGDTTLWSKINRLSLRKPPLLRIEGPSQLLPQWQPGPDLNRFTIHRQD